MASSPISFGKYDLVQPLKSDGAGELFLAGQVGLGGYDRQVVLKRFAANDPEQQQSIDMIMQHARAAAALSHPNLVATIEVGNIDGHGFIARESLQGISVAELSALLLPLSKSVPPRVGAAIARGVALGLDHAHHLAGAQGTAAGMTHGALTPHHILLGTNGAVKVIDLGVAYAESWLLQTLNGMDPDRLRYLAPEQLRGEPPSASADQFSLGVLTWELLTLRPLFAGGDANSTARLVMQGSAEPLTTAAPGCPPQIGDVVGRMLQVAPAQRFGRCAEIADALQAYLDGSGGAAEAELGAFVREVAGAMIAARQQAAQRAMAGDDAPVTTGSTVPTPGGGGPACPKCGQAQEADARFCASCGTRMPGFTAEIVSATSSRSLDIGDPSGQQVDVTLGGAAVILEDGQRYVEFDDDTGEFEALELSVDRVGPGSQYTETALRGRDEELGAVRASLEQAVAGTTQIILVTGVEGCGKTRLLTEIDTMAGIMGFTAVRAHGARYGVPVALDMLRQWVVAICAKLAKKPPRTEQLQRGSVEEALGWLVGIKLPDPLSRRLRQLFDGERFETAPNALEHRQRMITALMHFLWTVARAQPLLLLVDDAHRADQASLDLLHELRARLPMCRLAVLATGAPELTEGFGPSTVRVALRRLSSTDAVLVAEDFLFHGALPAELAQVLEDGASGNPLLITHQMRLLLEAQVLRFEEGTWSIPDIDASYIVTGTSDFTTERVERLPPASLHAARVSAVAGDVISRTLVEAACVGQGVSAHQAIDDNMGRGLMVSLRQSREYQTFRQFCSRDHLLADTPPEVLKKINLGLATAYERDQLAAPGVTQELIARHLLAAEGAEGAPGAARQLATAADKLLHQGVPKLAADMLIAAMRVGLNTIKTQGQIREEAAAYLFSLCEMATRCLTQVNPLRASGLVVTLLDRLPRDLAPRERARALRRRAIALIAVKRPQDAKAAIDLALHALGQGQDPTMEAMLRAEQSLVLEASGAVKEACAIVNDALKALSQSSAPTQAGPNDLLEFVATLNCRLARLVTKLKRPDLALAPLQRAREIAQSADLPLMEIRALSMAAAIAVTGGQLDTALTSFDQARQIAEEIMDPWSMARVYLEHGKALASTARDQATDLLKKSAHWAQLSGQDEIAAAAREALGKL